jgi:hypothetical protein
MTRHASLFTVGAALALVLGACGSSGTNPGRQDSGVPPQVDGPVGQQDGPVGQHDGPGGQDGPAGTCTKSGFTPAEQTAEVSTDGMQYQALSSTTAPADLLWINFYYGYGDPPPLTGPGTFTLGETPDEQNWATCGTCVLLLANCDDQGACDKYFFAESGTLTVTDFQTGGNFAGTLTNARLVEVTIDTTTYDSTPVPGGDTWCLSSYAFDAALSGSLPCTSTADCAGSADTPYCNTETSECVQCLQESHCTSLSATPHCDVDYNTCVECVSDAHCTGSNGHFCSNSLCGACNSSFDCTLATAPSCNTDATTDRTVCGVVTGCTPEDNGEDGDDGPAGAQVLTAGVPLTARKICSAPTSGTERDFYKFDNPTIGDVTFTLTWNASGTSAPDLDLAVYTFNGTFLGDAQWGPGTEIVKLTYLAAGTYYARIAAYSAATPADYTIGVTATPATCSGDADCSVVYSHQYLRGKCQAGACVFIEGNGALAADAKCDSADDCASGLCTYGMFSIDSSTFTFLDFHYMKNAATRAYCVPEKTAGSGVNCETTADCVSPKVCSLGFCLPKCTESVECPNLMSGGTAAIDGWDYAVCNTTSGVCEVP